jgi:D-amino-acid oxidase
MDIGTTNLPWAREAPQNPWTTEKPELPLFKVTCRADRALSGDLTVTPVRGQVVCVEQFGLEEWTLDAAGPTYVVPRSHDIVVGGTDADGAWEPRPDPYTANEIIERASALVPEIARAKVLAHRVGLRPARPTVRLGAEMTPAGGTIVHCYGHGGAGVTASWGCADDVLALVSSS